MTKEEAKIIIGNKMGEGIYNLVNRFFTEATNGEDFEKALENTSTEEFESFLDDIFGQLNNVLTLEKAIDIKDQLVELPEKDPNIN